MTPKTTRWALGALAVAVLLGVAWAGGDRKQPRDRIEKVLHRLELLEERVARLEMQHGFHRLLEAARRGDGHAREMLERMAHEIHEVLREGGGEHERIRREIEEREARVHELKQEMERLRAGLEGRHEPSGALEELEHRIHGIERRLDHAREQGQERAVEELEGMLARHRDAMRLARKRQQVEHQLRVAVERGERDRAEQLERHRDELSGHIERLVEGRR
jgi:DNA repair exonuclease SbcCD ATPase subunit